VGIYGCGSGILQDFKTAVQAEAAGKAQLKTLIHSSVDGHLVLIWAFMNNVSYTVFRNEHSFLLGIQRVGLLSLMVNSVKPSEELPDCFPKWVHHFTLPSAMYGGFNFSTV
jgi:hypothetical protein